jgi:hypothetical protein
MMLYLPATNNSVKTSPTTAARDLLSKLRKEAMLSTIRKRATLGIKNIV